MGDEQDHSGPQTPSMQETLEPLIGYLHDAAQRYTTLLTRDDWKPSRAHVEQARNTIVSAANTLQQTVRAMPPQRCSDETAHNVRDATIKEIARYLDEEGHGIPAEKVRFMGPAVTRPERA